MKRNYFIVSPSADINGLCQDLLDETCFHQAITVVEPDKSKKSLPAWEMNLLGLRLIRNSAINKGIPLSDFKVAVKRNRSKETFRWVQKKEYIKGYQSQNKRPDILKKILARRRAK